jgi:lipopolysaccharide/colanic/teichoic acid biosynthesis glycosyltransferase
MTPDGPDSRLRVGAEALMAAVLLLVLSPLLGVVALAVRLTSAGPVLFRQERLGVMRRPFTILKFRTMTVGNDDRQHREYVTAVLTAEQTPHGGEEGVYKLVDDPRVTRVGALLRRTSIDELPQLWNVVRGEMALVGPRPALAWEAPLFPDWAVRRFDVRPGLTGLWQVRGRSRLSYKDALALDVEYVETRSLWVDAKILVATLGVLLDVRRAR